jgi:pyruvate,water dikinase
MTDPATNSCLLTRLSEAGAADLFGQKVSRLSQIQNEGLPVPDGWVIDAKLFQQQLQAAGVFDRIQRMVDEVGGDPAAAAQVSAAVGYEVAGVTLSARFTDSLRVVFDSLSANGPVVIRSSAVGEDSHDAAFAGLLDSILNVDSMNSLIDAVRTCWASCWSPHASLVCCLQGIRLVRDQMPW